MSLIEVKNISKIYKDEDVETQALKDVSFTIEKGEFVAIMGPSGSGKSTLLQILGFLDRQTAGSYKLNNKTMDQLSDDELAKIRNKKMGFVFQSFNLLPRTSVFENVLLPLIYSDFMESEWNNRVEAAIMTVGLAHRKTHEPSQLSGGEKQRAAIARALVNDPEIIFADEPTGNLDTKSGKIIMETLQDLNEKEGRTIILITHETYTAEHAQRILFMRDGMLESDRQVAERHFAKNSFHK
jgi:putative ABC transport system ATP-binding protein